MKTFVKKLTGAPELGAALPLVILVCLATALNPSFVSSANLLDILRSASYSCILAVPMTFLLSARMFDLSVGATTTLGGIVAAYACAAGLPVFVSILLGCLVGFVVGAINGYICVYCKLPGFIATLGMQYLLNGIVMVLTNNDPVSGLSDGFLKIAQTRLFNGRFSIVIIYAAVLVAVGAVIIKRTKYGRECMAVGGNEQTAYLAGINCKARQFQLYIIVAVFAALSGVLYASRFASAQTNAGTGTEMTIIASVIIGGSSLYGGAGSIIGSALGCILFATINNSLIFMHVSINYQRIIYGLILICALFIDQYRRKKSLSTKKG